MSISQNDLQALSKGSGNVLSSSGDKIGGIGQLYLDDATGEPSWVTVKTGLFGTSESFVPLGEASASGDDITVPYSKDKIKDAPQVEADGSITPEEEQELYRYYEMSGQSEGHRGHDDGRSDRADIDAVAGDRRGDDAAAGDRRGDDAAAGDRRGDDAGVVGDTSSRGRADGHGNAEDHGDSDATVTRSEEELRVGTRKQEVGKARLRKYVVTENVTTTVPVEREEVRIEREPITDGDTAVGDGDLGDEDVEVTLTEEVPVVEKERVAKEKVRIAKDTVTEDAQVSEEVRKEKIDTDVDGDRDAR